MNEVVGSQIVYVPAGAVFSAGQQSALLVTGIFVAIFTLAAIAITVFFRRVIVGPLGGLAAATQALSRGTLSHVGVVGVAPQSNRPEIPSRGDEIGQLAERFEFMTREVYSREERLRQARADVARRATEVPVQRRAVRGQGPHAGVKLAQVRDVEQLFEPREDLARGPPEPPHGALGPVHVVAGAARVGVPRAKLLRRAQGRG